LPDRAEQLGSAPLPSLLLRLSVPSVAATVATSLYNVVDTLFVSWLGHQAIAALAVVFPYQIIVIAVGVGTGAGVSALVSRRFGEGDIEAANHAGGQVFFLSACWGVLFLFLAAGFAEPILAALGATPDITEQARLYLIITSCGAPALVFILVAGSLIRASGDAVRPMVMMIAASVLNMVLDPFLILGIGPFPALGIRGAALATVVAQCIGALIGLYYLLGLRTSFRIRSSHVRPDPRLIADICRVGMPASVQEVTESLAFICFNRVLSGYGSVALAAIGIAMRAADLAFMPIIGVSNALLPVVGYNFGAGNEKRLWSAVRLSCIGIMAAMAMLTVVYEVFAPQIVGLFSHDSEVVAAAVPALRIGMASIALIAPNVMFVATFQGLCMGKTALLLALTRQFLVFVPLVYLFEHLWGLTGAWVAMPASDTLGFIISFGFIYRQYRLRQQTGVGVTHQPDPVARSDRKT